MAQEKLVLGFDVGGTKIGVGLGSSEGRILGKARIENVDTYPDDILPQMVDEAKKLVSGAGLKMEQIAAFGISAPFPADPVNGIMTAPTNNRHWRNVPILQYLRDNLKLPGCFENDANCGALAEWFFGAGRGCRDFIPFRRPSQQKPAVGRNPDPAAAQRPVSADRLKPAPRRQREVIGNFPRRPRTERGRTRAYLRRTRRTPVQLRAQGML